MTKHFTKAICAVAVLGLLACGENKSPVSTLGNNNTGDFIPIGNSKDTVIPGNGTTQSDRVVVPIQIDPAFQVHYAGMMMEINLGTVIGGGAVLSNGKTNLDAYQGGDITFYINDHGAKSTRVSHFTSGGHTLADVKNNKWRYDSRGELVWSGAFEGEGGGLVLIVDKVYQSNDGGSAYDLMSGSVWFYKWPSQRNPSGPLARCWDVTLGPYDCRYSASGDSSRVSLIGNSTTPEGSQYVKIGTFNRLSKKHAFNESY